LADPLPIWQIQCCGTFTAGTRILADDGRPLERKIVTTAESKEERQKRRVLNIDDDDDAAT